MRSFVVIGVLTSLATTQAFAMDCSAQFFRVRGQAHGNMGVELKTNPRFHTETPGQSELINADPHFPYNLSVVSTQGKRDVLVVVIPGEGGYATASSISQGALDSQGRFRSQLTWGFANGDQDRITIDCSER